MLSFHTCRTNYPLTMFICVCCFAFSNLCSAGVIIDGFLTQQIVPGNSSDCAPGLDMIGGERDINVSSSTALADVNTTSAAQLYYTSGSSNLNYLDLVYDGVDGSYGNHAYDGLGHIDLTDGGTCNGLAINLTQVPSYDLNIWVYVRQGEDKYGFAYAHAINDPQTIFLPFDEFVPTPPSASLPGSVTTNSFTLVDFTDVGYINIEMNIWGGDDELTVSSIYTAYGIPEPATMMILGLGALILSKRNKPLH